MSHSMLTTKSSAALRVMCVIGSRAELVKMAPVIRRMQAERAEFYVHVVLIGQHCELLRRALPCFNISADSQVDVPSTASSSILLSSLVSLLDAEIANARPSVLIAQGDAPSALACALTSHHRQVRFVHLEAAGTRAPRAQHKDATRRMISMLADLHCAPTARARDALLAEKVPAERVLLSGDTAVDSLLDALSKQLSLPLVIAPKQKMALLSLHRADIKGAPAERVFRTVRHLCLRNPDVDFVHAAHPDASVRRAAYSALAGFQNVRLIEPVDYPEFVALMARATLILTDSSGIEEVAPSLGVPLLVLRERTERPEGVDAGCATLVGTDPDLIFTEAQQVLNAARSHHPRPKAVSPYGDGCAAQRIVYEIKRRCGTQPHPQLQLVRASIKPRFARSASA